VHVQFYKTIHDIYVIENCEEEVENINITNSLEGLFNG
jgi:predicted nucleotidyltransferase